MENPKSIMEAVNQLQNARPKAQAQGGFHAVICNAAAIFDDGYSYVGGTLTGDLTLSSFMDYRCGSCKKRFPSRKLVTRRHIRFL